MKQVLYFAIATSFFAAQIFTFDFSFFQLSLFRITISIVPLLLVIYTLKSTTRIYLLPKSKNKYSIKFMIIWLLYSIVSLLWVKDYALAFRSLYFITSGVICTVIFSIFFRKKRDFWICFNIVQLMIMMHNMIGWYEIFTKDYKFMSSDNILYYANIDNGIPVSMMGNPNDFATLALCGVIVSYICFSINKTTITKFLSATLMLSNAILVLLTNSRANIIGLLLSLGVYFVLTKKAKKATLIILITLSFITLIIINQELVISFILKMNDVLSFNFHTERLNSEGTRLNLIKNGFYFLKSTFGFGTGVGNIEYWMQHKAIYPTKSVTNIHNWWMEILAGYGIIIFILYIKFYGRLYKDIFKVYRRSTSNFEKTISLGILAFMTGFIIAGISSSSNISREWLWVFWSLAIAFQGYVNNSENNECLHLEKNKKVMLRG